MIGSTFFLGTTTARIYLLKELLEDQLIVEKKHGFRLYLFLAKVLIGLNHSCDQAFSLRSKGAQYFPNCDHKKTALVRC